ncbi:hypothetical protein [Pseudoalteromonas aurantia]|uniref:hypothetical protein n=1 Tax=Pseudoalteromonas aurantia TaxID=43654 RepID=UPI001487049F|nr:hypothetical protein [Pseudoalteromonas aurantia]
MIQALLRMGPDLRQEDDIDTSAAKTCTRKTILIQALLRMEPALRQQDDIDSSAAKHGS